MIATHQALSYPFALGGDTGGHALLEQVFDSLAVDGHGSDVATKDEYQLHLVDHRRATARRGDQVIHDGTIGSAVSSLMTAINTAAIASVGSVPVVHAAVVARAGAGVVIPGRAGAGKSTLCVTLVAHGYQYVSDETAPLLTGGRVLVYAKPIVVGAGSFEVLAGWRHADRAGGLPDMWFVDPRRLPGGIAPEPPSLRAVVEPEFRPGAPLDVVDLSPGEITALLASHLFNLRQLGRPALERCAQLAPRLRGVRIAYSDARDALSVIDELGLDELGLDELDTDELDLA